MKLLELLENYNLDQLNESASYLGLAVKETSSKEELINQICTYLLNEFNFKRLLYILPDECYEAIIDGTLKEASRDDVKLYSELRIYSMGFVNNDKLIIPDEYFSLLKKFNTKEEKEYREKEQFIYACVNFANIFYCVYPFEALKNLVSINTRLHYSNQEIKDRVAILPEAVGATYISSINGYANIHNDFDIEDLIKTQGNLPFYRPSYNEIMEFFKKGYINSSYYDKFMSYSAYFNDGIGEEARIITFNTLATLKEVDKDLFESIYDRNKFENITKENEVRNNFYNMIRNTRNVWKRGFTNYELFARKIY